MVSFLDPSSSSTTLPTDVLDVREGLPRKGSHSYEKKAISFSYSGFDVFDIFASH